MPPSKSCLVIRRSWLMDHGSWLGGISSQGVGAKGVWTLGLEKQNLDWHTSSTVTVASKLADGATLPMENIKLGSGPERTSRMERGFFLAALIRSARIECSPITRRDWFFAWAAPHKVPGISSLRLLTLLPVYHCRLGTRKGGGAMNYCMRN